MQSVLFELVEYSLEHQLPNFQVCFWCTTKAHEQLYLQECWWDHWILDVLLCNNGGILMGLLTLHYLDMKEYNWRAVWNIPTLRFVCIRISSTHNALQRQDLSCCSAIHALHVDAVRLASVRQHAALFRSARHHLLCT